MFGGEHAVFISQILNVVIITLLVGIPTLVLVRLMRAPRRHSSLEILKQRLARGDIEESEFLRLRALLRDDAPEKSKRGDDTVDATQPFAADGDTLDADSFSDRRRLRRNWPK
ncbi:MAG: hypothetical protein IT320_18480 [Anaerolineae bacterium]|nr:hypothetical protein [Anaerolineae bacterium]